MTRLITLAAIALFSCPLGCSSDGGKGGGGSSAIGGLCTKEDTKATSAECGGNQYCLVEGCTGRCTPYCTEGGNACPDGFTCGPWLSADVVRCYPETKCTEGGDECGEGFECVLWVDCGGPALNVYSCVPTSFEVPPAGS